MVAIWWPVPGSYGDGGGSCFEKKEKFLKNLFRYIEFNVTLGFLLHM